MILAGASTTVSASATTSSILPAYNVYETADGGKLALGMVESSSGEPFCDAIGHPEIKGDGLKRRWEAPESFKIVEEVIKSKPLAEWMEWLEDKDFCIAKVKHQDRSG